MRMKLAAALVMILTAPAWSEVGDDFAVANRIFGQVAPAPVVDGLNGEWLPLSVLANLGGAKADPDVIVNYLERFCGKDPGPGHAVTVSSDSSFTMEVAGRTPVTYRYDWLGGARFGRSFDPDALVGMLGIDTMTEDKIGPARARALSNAPREVDIYRVSADILVIKSSNAADIYGRCPD